MWGKRHLTLFFTFRQVEEALAQYQDTKKERERGIAYLNKKVRIFYLFVFLYTRASGFCLQSFRPLERFLLHSSLSVPISFSLQAKKLSRQQGINESTQMDVEGRKEALSRTGEEEKEEKGEAMEEGDGDKEG